MSLGLKGLNEAKKEQLQTASEDMCSPTNNNNISCALFKKRIKTLAYARLWLLFSLPFLFQGHMKTTQ